MGQHARPETKKIAKSAPTPRLKAGVLRVPRADGVFIGLQHHGICITGVGASAVTEKLDGKHSRLDIAISTGVPRERVDQIINILANKNLIDVDYQDLAFTPAIAERMEPELAALSYRQDCEDGGLTQFLQRQHRTVEIFGLDRIGSSIASLLSASGIGAIRAHDQRKVSPVDVAGATYRMSDVGHDRQEVASAHARDSAPLEPRRARGVPDLVVLSGYPTPEDLLHLGMQGCAYLLVHSDPTSAVIGPLVLPSQTPCARCIALHQSDVDTQWGSIEMARLLQEHRYVPAANVAALAAAAATAHALLFLDTGTAPSIGATMRVDAATGASQLMKWHKHPLCGCSWDYHHS